jgi:hypothetical protein
MKRTHLLTVATDTPNYCCCQCCYSLLLQVWKHWPVASRYSELLQQFKLVLVSGLPHAASATNTNSSSSSSGGSSSSDSLAVWCDAVQSLRSFGLPWAQVLSYIMHTVIIVITVATASASVLCTVTAASRCAIMQWCLITFTS